MDKHSCLTWSQVSRHCFQEPDLYAGAGVALGAMRRRHDHHDVRRIVGSDTCHVGGQHLAAGPLQGVHVVANRDLCLQAGLQKVGARIAVGCREEPVHITTLLNAYQTTK